jgi:hypothetical protein
MNFAFAGRIIANPAPVFFETPVISSADPELDGASGGAQTPQQAALHRLLRQELSPADFSHSLAGHNIKYVLLNKGSDDTYDFLADKKQFRLLADYPSLQLYENTAWRPL